MKSLRGIPPLEALRLRLRLRDGGRDAKRPMSPRLANVSLGGRWPWVDEPPPMLASAAPPSDDNGGPWVRSLWCFGEVGSDVSFWKGSAMIRAESKSGNISGPRVLMTSVTSAESLTRFARSLTRVLAEVGFRERTRGRRDLIMSIPVSPNRRAAKVIEMKKATLETATTHKGTHCGT